MVLAAPGPSGGYGYGVRPAYGHAVKQGPACRTEYDTVITKNCATSYQEACRTQIETKYKTVYETQCETINVKQCVPVVRQVPDQVCQTRNEQICTQDTQKTYEISYEKQCQDVAKQVGVFRHHVTLREYFYFIVMPRQNCAPAAGGYGHGRYGRSADPSGYGPKCTTVVQKVCTQHPVKVPKYVNVPRCSNVPRTECKDTVRSVTDTQCNDIPQKKCSQVPKQVILIIETKVWIRDNAMFYLFI